MNYIDINTCFGTLPNKPFDVSAQGLAELLARDGISQAVTVSLAGAYLGADEGNQDTLSASREHPPLLPAATVDPRTYYGKGDLILKARESGFVMLRLFNRVQEWPLDFSPVEVIFEEAHEAGLPVMVDVVWFGDITRAAQLAVVTETPVVLAGVEPDKLSEAVVSMTEFPDLYVDTSLFTTPEPLKLLCDEIGPERILFGSGAALSDAGTARLALETSSLSDQDIRRIASLNALRLLRIP